jgi:hypothetical protein
MAPPHASADVPSRRSWRERLAPHLVLIVLALMICAAFGAVVASGVTGAPSGCGCAAAWSLTPATPVAPGAAGCSSLEGETCFSAELESAQGGVALSALDFAVTEGPTNSSNAPTGAPVPLGAAAAVTVYGPDGGFVGSWNWSRAAWGSGASWAVPGDENVTLVLDSGLQQASFAGDTFWTFVTSPDEGSIGVQL